MKRDLGLVRELLLKVERLHGPAGSRWLGSASDPEFQVEGFGVDEINQHLRLLADADFLLNAKTGNDGVMLEGLSWQGCEFLEAVRSPEVWRRTKAATAKVGVASLQVFFDVAKVYAKQVAEEQLGLRLG